VSIVNILANGQPMKVSAGRFTVFVMQQGIKIDVPDAVEISHRTTIPCMEKMSDRAWKHISKGELFPHLLKTAMPGFEPPGTIAELLAGDEGVVHLCGLIVLFCEAHFDAKKNGFPPIYLRNPETLLHPATEQRFMTMIYEALRLLTGYDPKIG